MAKFKDIVGLMFVVLYIVGTSCQEMTNEVTAKQNKDREALLKAMMYISETAQSDSLHTRVKRGAGKRHHRRRPNWKDHPLYPLYPIDFEVCEDSPRESKNGLCDSWEKAGYCKKAREIMKTYCKKTCGMCKARSPVACKRSKFGCCWDNDPAKGINGEGCLPCFDIYRITCPQFKDYCGRQDRNGRFIRYHCFNTCGRCAM
ncbi:uncharacterized protein LOC116308207 [Actinia tenebrosa]|uniref:Uncharacterized protein LOC116308207 n=1 Tax=Actinia tenebrosa TaxID=6105 RepID=A0A6P8J9J8_ACTTE|nr:uncharacterized protein LOC116308207 [Actinia tenebrosa]